MSHDPTTFDANTLQGLAELSAEQIAELDAQHANELNSDYFRRECEVLCSRLDSLLDEAYAENNDETPLTKEEFAEYEREFNRLKNLLEIQERRMQISREFEAREGSDGASLH
jgi:hypothetical protein